MSPIDRSSPPAPGPLRTFTFPPVVRERLDTGLALRVAALPRLPVATALLVLPAGEDTLAAARAGTAVLAGDALEGGTRRRSGIELAEAFERLGAELEVGTGWNATTVSASCLAERLPEVLALLAEVVREPAFPEDEVARVRAQQLARVRQRAMDPGALASDRTLAEVYAPGEPYGRGLQGTPASLAGVGPGALH
ncbi:MAG: insulinase family protein, partial [Longimicrobiales bacterium]|nr:insulinase family protein [Longimicrobiales bacterium]